jgi:hypothetical protein
MILTKGTNLKARDHHNLQIIVQHRSVKVLLDRR